MAEASGIITLLSDFGEKDPFVGVMKGVILARFPAARLVDLTHGIAPQDVMGACFWLAAASSWFPAGTVHVAVVDPGVGSARAALAVEASGQLFLGPDNGLLGEVLRRGLEADVRRIEPERFGLAPSATFDGRDLFAPLAAELASGRARVADLGPATRPEVESALPPPRTSSGRITGLVVAVDRFGNLITNIHSSLLERLISPRIHVAKHELGLSRTYADAETYGYVALVNSFGYLEIARNGGDAAAGLGVCAGIGVQVLAGGALH